MVQTTLKPRYEHDCDRCVFLGQYREYDLYYCSGEPTIICRYSSDGPDYGSGLIFGITSESTKYQECLVRALRNPEFREQITKYFNKYYSGTPRIARFKDLCKIADTDEKDYPLLIHELITEVAINYLETRLKEAVHG